MELLELIRILQLIIGVFGCLGNLLIIIIFFIHINSKTIALEMLFYLSFSSLMNTLSYSLYFNPIEGNVEETCLTCKIQAFLMVSFELSLFIVCSLITYFIYKSNKIIYNQQDKLSWKARSIILFLSYGIPLIIGTLFLYFDILGLNGRWCWISSKYDETFALINYIFIWFLIIISMIFVIKIKYDSPPQGLPKEEIENRKNYIKQLSMYPIISFLAWLPATCNRFVFIIFRGHCQWVEICHILCIQSQGLAYSIVSFSTLEYKKIFEAICDKCCNCCCNCCCFSCFSLKHNSGLNESLTDIGKFMRKNDSNSLIDISDVDT